MFYKKKEKLFLVNIIIIIMYICVYVYCWLIQKYFYMLSFLLLYCVTII